MRFTSSLIAVGTLLLTGASISSARALPSLLGAQALDGADEDVSNCDQGFCDYVDTELFEKRVPPPVIPGVGAGAGAAEAAAAEAAAAAAAARAAANAQRPSQSRPQGRPEEGVEPVAPPRPLGEGTVAEGSGTGAASAARPAGISTQAENKLWDDLSGIVERKEFGTLNTADEGLLYTGAAQSERNNFARAFKTAQPDKDIRHIGNMLNRPAITDARGTFTRGAPEGQSYKAAAVASFKVGEIMKAHPGDVHILFPTAAVAERAVVSKELPNGFLKSYEVNVLTSEGTQVRNVFAWDVETFQTKLATQGFQAPKLWQAGDPPLGRPVDFSVDPKSVNTAQ